MTTDATQILLDALEHYRNPKHGKDRYNTPWRPDADGGTLSVKRDDAYGLGLAWYDHKEQRGGNGYTLARELGVELPHEGVVTVVKKPVYSSLEHYASAHGVPVDVLTTAGWRETKRRGHLAFRFVTAGGERYRYADEHAAERKYDHATGWRACWYGLAEATALAAQTPQPLVICNGEVSTLAAQHHGVAACCVAGGERASIAPDLLDALKQAWQGPILIALDCDAQGRKAQEGLVKQLAGAGFDVKGVDLRGSHGFDLADFCYLHNGTSVQTLQQQAIAPQKAAQPATGASQREYVGDWRQQGVTLHQLKRTHFDAMQWVIEGMLPEGACLLAGKPKTKKSWLALGVAMAVAMNGKALGKLDTASGGVLYLDLESNQRRMKSRARAMLGDSVEWPDNFTIFTEWPRGPEAIDRLDEWMVLHPETRVVVVDILQKIRAPRDKNANPYDEDYTAIQSLNAFAERHRITAIVIHHTRKGKADDVFDEISGTTGLTGGTATMWIIGRVPGEVDQSVLHIRGRDVDDAELALGWDDYLCQHVIEGDAALAAQSRERQEILDAMEPGEQYGPKDIAAMVGKSVTNIKKLIRHLLDDNFVTKAAYGKYEKLLRSGHSGHSGISTHSGYSGHSSKSDHLEARVTKSDQGVVTLSTAPQSPKTPQNGKSDQSERYSVEGIRTESGEEWRVWNDITNLIVARFATEAEAIDDVRRREAF